MKKLYVEIADNHFRRENGLMNRKKMGSDEGMLFKFPSERHLAFWMKNTYIPLDIAFLDKEGRITQIESMSPLSTKMVKSENTCRYAIEVNRNWFKQNNVSVGSKILNLTDCKNSRKFAQTTPMEDLELMPQMPSQDIPDPIEPQMDQETEQTQPNENVLLNMSHRQKLDYATNYNLPVLIVYRTKGGNTLPPRRLMPIPGEGYPVESGKNGYHFKGLDVSPNIAAGGIVIEGGHPKSFILDNVIGLEIINEGK